MSEFATSNTESQPSALEPSVVSDDLRERLYQFLLPLLTMLDCLIDVRLVRTFWQSIETILLFRNRTQGLLLSELGGYLLSPAHAPAGTKRLSNLLRCDKWASDLVGDYLWKQAAKRQEQLHEEGKEAFLLWDESVNEKPESRKVEGLCPVRSSKAQRLARSRPGLPSRPVFVNGFQWMGLLLIGMSGSPTVAFMQWFTTRTTRDTKEKKQATDLVSVRYALLKKCWAAWQDRVLHLFDRGYASAKWIEAGVEFKLRFVLRWPKRHKLLSPDGDEKHAWQLFQGKPAWDERMIRDTVQNKTRRLGILATLVEHPQLPNVALWLVCARPGDGKEPWYLLTTEPIRNADDAFRIVLAYARRWQIEMAFRFGKSELAMESPRLWTLERRTKMLMLVTLAYAFLLSLLDDSLVTLRTWVLDTYCHRTGKRCREAKAPLYRLRIAISRLWQEHPEPRELYKIQSSG
jgi:hypothetical protein